MNVSVQIFKWIPEMTHFGISRSYAQESEVLSNQIIQRPFPSLPFRTIWYRLRGSKACSCFALVS